MRTQFLRALPRTSIPQIQKQFITRNMSTEQTKAAEISQIETTPNEATGVKLSEQQKLIAGSVLDVSLLLFNRTFQFGKKERRSKPRIENARLSAVVSPWRTKQAKSLKIQD